MIILKSKINVDKRGKITTGTKAVSKTSGKEFPKATDYFVLEDFPELKESYGEKPTKLVLFFPSNEIQDFFNVDMVLYGTNQTLIRKCNEDDECIHRIEEEINGVKYKASQVSDCICPLLEEDSKKKCKAAMYLKAFVANRKTGKIENPQCYLFYSGSRNTAENIYSELNKIQSLVGSLVGIPFGLSVKMVSGKTNATQRFPIWSLQVLGTLPQLKTAISSYLFDYKKILSLEGMKSSAEFEKAKEVVEAKYTDDSIIELDNEDLDKYLSQLADKHNLNEEDKKNLFNYYISKKIEKEK